MTVNAGRQEAQTHYTGEWLCHSRTTPERYHGQVEGRDTTPSRACLAGEHVWQATGVAGMPVLRREATELDGSAAPRLQGTSGLWHHPRRRDRLPQGEGGGFTRLVRWEDGALSGGEVRIAASLARFTSGMSDRAFLRKGSRAACATSPSTQPSRRGGRLLLLVAAAALVVSACGSPASKSPTKTPTPTPVTSGTPSATPDASDVSVLAAYQAYIAAIDQADAATSGPGAWNLPVLSATMINPLLQAWQNEFLQYEAQDIVVEGALTAQHPRVISNTGTTAVVSDCVWDGALEYYGSPNGGTPQLDPSQPDLPSGGGDGVRIDFTLVSGKWMASQDASWEYGNCTGY